MLSSEGAAVCRRHPLLDEQSMADELTKSSAHGSRTGRSGPVTACKCCTATAAAIRCSSCSSIASSPFSLRAAQAVTVAKQSKATRQPKSHTPSAHRILARSNLFATASPSGFAAAFPSPRLRRPIPLTQSVAIPTQRQPVDAPYFQHNTRCLRSVRWSVHSQRDTPLLLSIRAGPRMHRLLAVC